MYNNLKITARRKQITKEHFFYITKNLFVNNANSLVEVSISGFYNQNITIHSATQGNDLKNSASSLTNRSV